MKVRCWPGVIAPSEETPFYAARDAALSVLAGLGHQADIVAWDAPTPGWASGRCARIHINGKDYGVVGEIDAEARRIADLDAAAAMFEIDLERFGGEFLKRRCRWPTCPKPIPGR